MDPLRMIVALVPLAGYLLLLSFLNLRRYASVVSGARDSLLLGLGLSGLALVGPLELLLPESTAFRFGQYAWLMLGCFYLLSLVLVVMVERPRMVIYNSDVETIRPALSQVVRKMDEQARWSGDTVLLPSVGVRLYLDRHTALRNVQLVSIGSEQSYAAWTALEKGLRTALKQVPCERGVCGSLFVMFAVAVLVLIGMTCLRDQGEIARSYQELLHW
jgi:hypothetical protein